MNKNTDVPTKHGTQYKWYSKRPTGELMAHRRWSSWIVYSLSGGLAVELAEHKLRRALKGHQLWPVGPFLNDTWICSQPSATKGPIRFDIGMCANQLNTPCSLVPERVPSFQTHPHTHTATHAHIPSSAETRCGTVFAILAAISPCFCG